MSLRYNLSSLVCFTLCSLAPAADPLKADQVKPAEVKPADIRFGTSSDPLPAKKAADLGLGKNVGLVVTTVEANGLAAKAGVKKGDILVEFGEKPVSSDPAAFRKLMRELPKNEPLTLVIYRDGVKTDLTVAPLDPIARAGRLENEMEPRNRLENKPISEGTTKFNVMYAMADQDVFQVFASGEGLSYEVSGRFREGKKLIKSIKIVDDGKVVAEVKSLDKVPEGHSKAVDYLLGTVNKK
jgi:membrane-associated protease RseP (regulator of RpoE activity)